MAVQIYLNHPKINEIKKGRPIRDKLAKELCETCGCEWGEPVSFENIWYFESVFNAIFYIMAMKEIPLLGDTTNFYNTLLYKSEKKRCYSIILVFI